MSNYFQNLLTLLNTEREEDKKSYLLFAQQTSVAQRREAGFTWFPVAIRGTEISRADYLTVEIERTTHPDIIHQLRSGASAVLFSQHDAKNQREEGIISWQSGNRLGLTLRTDELPDWASGGKLGVDLLFDDNSYDEMTAALKTAQSLQDEKGGALIRILTTNHQLPTFNTDATAHNSLLITHNSLNPSQQRAVQTILSANHLAIVHGPPGTGKTTTLVEAIKALYSRDGKQILVAAPSNAAVDLLSEKLSAAGLNVLRIGNPARVSDALQRLTLDSKVSEHATFKDIKKLKKQAAEYKTMAHKYKRSFGKAEREQRNALFNEARKLMKEADAAAQYVADDVLSKAAVITATLVGANHSSIKARRYDTVVIDEAGQALEPACWIPILKGSKLILAGDHQQLPPTVKSGAARNGLSLTLLEKSVRLHPEAVIMLDEQYRMNSLIMSYSSIVFYEGRLRAHSSVATHLLFPGDLPLLFIDTAGCGWEETREGTGITNREEAVFLIRLLLETAAALSPLFTPESFPSVAVISPYRQQVELLREGVVASPGLQTYSGSIAVNTIDSFQGAERDIVYISLVRSNAEGDIGFLSDIRRTNVAMTRTRKKLVIIGDSATLSVLPFYAELIEFAQANGAYQSAWEYLG